MAESSYRTSTRRLWPVLREVGRQLRADSTDAEALLWRHLRASSIGVKFRRQHVIDRFVVDFFCEQAGLILEVDGPIHAQRHVEDRAREERISELGYEVLRFTNTEVFEQTDWVLKSISEAIEHRLRAANVR